MLGAKRVSNSQYKVLTPYACMYARAGVGCWCAGAVCWLAGAICWWCGVAMYGSRYGMYVATIKKKGVAKQVPRIKKGMQIMRINDTKLNQGIYIEIELQDININNNKMSHVLGCSFGVFCRFYIVI